jgi:shikimate kinase
MKQLIVLIGLKGSGKTYIGSLAEKELGIPFLRVEPIFLSIKKDRHYFDKDYVAEGFKAVEQEIANLLKEHSSVIIESTGIAQEFRDMIERILQEGINVRYVKIDTPAEVCLSRVKNRDSKDHVNVSDEDVMKINKLAGEQAYEYDIVIDNLNSSDAAIMQAIASLK